MDNSYGLEKLNEVWNRVTATGEIQEQSKITVSAVSEHSDKETLQGFIEDESNDFAYYKKLAAKSNRASRIIFNKIACDEYSHLKKLQKMYFILTGDSYMPQMKNQEIPSMLSALRNRYIAETKGQAAYESASAITSNKKLAQIYIELASDEKLHAGEIERLIEKAMG